VKVIAVDFVEDCLDGTSLRDLRLEHPVDKDLVHHLAGLGEIDFYSHFPIPYFRGNVCGAGVMGTTGSISFRAVLPRADRDLVLQRLIAAVGSDPLDES